MILEYVIGDVDQSQAYVSNMWAYIMANTTAAMTPSAITGTGSTQLITGSGSGQLITGTGSGQAISGSGSV